jgi:hypothetical protein
MGLFEYLAKNDESQRVANRKAVAVANKRVSDHFGPFLKNASSEEEFDARFSMIEDDIFATVASVCEEYKIEKPQAVTEAITSNIKESFLDGLLHGIGDTVKGVANMFGGGQMPGGGAVPGIMQQLPGSGGSSTTPEPPAPGEGSIGTIMQQGSTNCPCQGQCVCGKSRTAFTRQARRPKMCPYHREVLDISLGTGDPQAGFNSMSQQAFTDHSCRGGFQGTCNFKPEMVTKDFWDQKAEQAEQKRRERQEQQAIEQVPQASEFEAPQLVDEAPAAPEEGTLTDQLSEAPSAVGAPAEPMAMAARVAATVPQPLVHGGTIAPLRQIAQRKPGLTINGLPYEQWEQEANERIGQGARPNDFEPVEVGHPKPAWEQVAADILNVGHEGPLRQYLADLKARKQQQQPPPDQQLPPDQAGPALASAKTAEALKTIDVDTGDGPEPKIDKRKWTPQNVVKRIEDAEMDGSPHPTVEQDIIEPPDYRGDAFSDDGRFDQTDAVTEKQDVTKGTESGQVPSVVKDNNGWSNSNGANPVTRETP